MLSLSLSKIVSSAESRGAEGELGCLRHHVLELVPLLC